MAADQGQGFRVGLLVVVGLAALVVLLFMTSRINWGSQYRVTAFLENAGGLRAGSPVTLSGIQIGEVDSIRPNNDNRGSIRVDLQVQDQYTLYEGASLRLLTSGIFGDSSLEFSGPGDPPGPTLAKDGSAAVVADPNLFDQVSQQAGFIMAGLADILDEKTRGNLKGSIENAHDLLESADQLSKRLEQSMDGMDDLMRSLRELSNGTQRTIERLEERGLKSLDEVDAGLAAWRGLGEVATEKSGPLLTQAEKTLTHIDDLSTELTVFLERNQESVNESLQSIQALSAEMEELLVRVRGGKGILGQLIDNEALAKDLNDTIINVNDLSERIADDPKILVWGLSEDEQRIHNKERQQKRIRRAYREGYTGGRHDPAAARGVILQDTEALEEAQVVETTEVSEIQSVK